jgi:CBS domain-containing protein
MQRNGGPRSAGPDAQEVRFWMSMPVVSINIHARLAEALALMHKHKIRRLPVVDLSGELVGIITDGDIRGVAIIHGQAPPAPSPDEALNNTYVHQVMTERPITVALSTTLREAALLMLDNKIGSLPVMGTANNLIGLITESDLFEALVCYLDNSVRTS